MKGIEPLGYCLISISYVNYCNINLPFVMDKLTLRQSCKKGEAEASPFLASSPPRSRSNRAAVPCRGYGSRDRALTDLSRRICGEAPTGALTLQKVHTVAPGKCRLGWKKRALVTPAFVLMALQARSLPSRGFVGICCNIDAIHCWTKVQCNHRSARRRV